MPLWQELVCSTSNPFSGTYRARLMFGGTEKCFTSYLWPCFLHVSFLQVVSRKLWHQLEQPRTEKRSVRWGGLGVSGRKSPTELPPALSPPQALPESCSPAPPQEGTTTKHLGAAPQHSQQPPGESPKLLRVQGSQGQSPPAEPRLDPSQIIGRRQEMQLNFKTHSQGGSRE